MATYAAQFEILWGGVWDFTNDGPASGWYAVFLEAGTATPKTAWEDRNKSVAITHVVLDGNGRAEVYGDGVYDIDFYDRDPTDPDAVFKGNYDGYKVSATDGNSRTISTDTTGSTDDQLILGDTSSGNVTYTAPDAAEATKPIIIKKIASTNTLTIAAPSGQTIDGLGSISITALNSSVTIVSNGANWYGAQTGAFVPLDGSTPMSGALTMVSDSIVLAAGGSEGGQFLLEKPASGTNLSDNVALDIGADSFRIFENGGTSRGFFLNVTEGLAGASAKIWHSNNDGSGSGLDADVLQGAAPAEAATASTIAKRDASGIIEGAAGVAGNDLVNFDQLSAAEAKVPGISQTWQDVSASRAFATTYTNATGRPISVSIVHNTVAGSTATLLVGTASPPTVVVSAASRPSGNTSETPMFAIVPPGHNYRLNGTSTFTYWAELRS